MKKYWGYDSLPKRGWMLTAKRGLAATAHAYDDLCQSAVEVKQPFLPAMAEFSNIELLEFFFLVMENCRKSIITVR